MKKLLLVIACMATLAGCSRDADVASRNLSNDADNFKVLRRVVFYNGITGEYILEVQGYCAIGNSDAARKLSITCKLDNGTYKKHYLGLSDNVTFFAEQIDGVAEGASHYKVTFKPSVIIPDVELR